MTDDIRSVRHRDAYLPTIDLTRSQAWFLMKCGAARTHIMCMIKSIASQGHIGPIEARNHIWGREMNWRLLDDRTAFFSQVYRVRILLQLRKS